MKAEIVFRNGAMVTVDVSNWTNIYDGTGSYITGFNWVDKRGGRQLEFISVEDVVAVVLDKER